MADRSSALFDLGVQNGRASFDALQDFLDQEDPETRFLQEELAVCDEFFPPPESDELKKILQERAELWDVQRAATFYKIIRYSYGAGASSYGGRPVDICRGLGQIFACSRRLKNVVVENLSYEEIIPRFDQEGTLLYIDPPYYKAECYDVPFDFWDHLLLQELINNCKGAFIVISYNDEDFVRKLYGFRYNVQKGHIPKNQVNMPLSADVLRKQSIGAFFISRKNLGQKGADRNEYRDDQDHRLPLA